MFPKAWREYLATTPAAEPGALVRAFGRRLDNPDTKARAQAATVHDPHRARPEADFVRVPYAGHTCAEPGIVHHPIEAANRFAR